MRIVIAVVNDENGKSTGIWTKILIALVNDENSNNSDIWWK